MRRARRSGAAASPRRSRTWAGALALAAAALPLLLHVAAAQNDTVKQDAAPAPAAAGPGGPAKPAAPLPGSAARDAAADGPADRPLRIGLTDNMPLCSLPDALVGREGEIEASEAFGLGLEGYLIDLLPHLLERSNLSARGATFVAMLGNKGGGPLPNGSYDGFVGQMREGRADMLLYSLTLTPERARAIGHTISILDAPGALAVLRSPQRVSGLVFFQSFTREVWLLGLTALVVTVFTLWGIDIVTRNARDKAEHLLRERDAGQRLPEPDADTLAESRRRDRGRRMKFAMESTMIALGQGGPPTTAKSWSVKLLFVCWTVFSVVVLACYTANLTAHFTVSTLTSTVNSLQDIRMSGRPFGAMRNSAESLFINKALDPVVASIRPQLRAFDDHADALAALRSGEIIALVEDAGTVTGFTQARPCDIGMASETFGSRQSVIALQPNSTLAVPLSQAILELEAQGVMTELHRKWFDDRSQCDDDPGLSQGGLGLADMWAIFALMAVGIAISLGMAGVEVWYHNRMKHRLKPAVQKMKQVLTTPHRLSASALRHSGSGGASAHGGASCGGSSRGGARRQMGCSGDLESFGGRSDGARDRDGRLAGRADGRADGRPGDSPDGRPNGTEQC
ncbi:hypothetical protein Rsub_09900 [Raphidocelis subcapitata]|uniref:Ionotropic glutamate receptor C-terminal domain-containing protein n=1 Tax=Raphidocelis subcapitata TaxID=307507 RepID=A0A2V0PIL3_9CHLO|nr:hypothetical protein Rsub_09900 [Raphidocelis subcapitata]|eukprot:GBF96895.1 hypothetical protein Rsub_09900 [Raphidocelis subcapitata]